MGNKQNRLLNYQDIEIKETIEDNIENTSEIEENKDIEKLDNKDKNKYKYNILFIGSSKIGTKTSLIKRIKDGKFIEIHENEDISEHFIIEKDDKIIILYLIDTKKLDNDYYKNADCIVMGYDVTNKKSFQELIDYWDKFMKEFRKKDLLIYLLANKIDLLGNVKTREKEGKLFAELNNIKFFPISVKNNINIDEFFKDLQTNIENNNHDNINNRINEILFGNPSKQKYKLALIGDSGVGSKTSFVNSAIRRQFDHNEKSTNGASYISKSIILKNGYEIYIDIWDTAGQEKYRSLTKFFLTDADVIVLGYDVTRRESFESVKNFWYNYAKENSKANLFYLLGNKIDLFDKRDVSTTEAQNYCKTKNIRYFEISCLNYVGIQEFFDDLTNELIKR